QLLLMPLRAHEDVGVKPLQFQNLRQCPDVPERIGIVADLGDAPEKLPESKLSVKPLEHQLLTIVNIDVRLDPPATHEVPPPLFDSPSDFCEHLRIGFRHPLVELS